jgi:hypothetical protein
MEANVKTNKVRGNVVNNLAAVEIVDNTTTRSVKPSGEKETANGVDVSISKNETFARLKEFFTPEGLIFDPSEIENQMQPLVTAGVISQAVLITAIEKARKEFQEKNKETISACENITFDDFLAKLKANEKLYTEVLNVCKLSEINESMVFDSEGNVVIYRGAQSTDKDGNARYIEDLCKVTDKLGKEHTEKIYKEIRTAKTVTNYIQAIRYYNTYTDICAKLVKKSKECTAPLELAVNAIRKAMEAGFSLEDITNEI